MKNNETQCKTMRKGTHKEKHKEQKQLENDKKNKEKKTEDETMKELNNDREGKYVATLNPGCSGKLQTGDRPEKKTYCKRSLGQKIKRIENGNFAFKKTHCKRFLANDVCSTFFFSRGR